MRTLANVRYSTWPALLAITAAVTAIPHVAQAQAAAPKLPELKPQQASTWCWAAASQMVLEIAPPGGPFFAQALQARNALKSCGHEVSNTCGENYPTYAGCNRPGFPAFELFGRTAETQPSPLCWPRLQEELDAGRPVLFGWCMEGHCGNTPRTSKGHWMVAVAAKTCTHNGAAVEMVQVFNPTPCCVGQKLWIPYDMFAAGAGKLKFWQNHFQVRLQGEPASKPTKQCIYSKAVTDFGVGSTAGAAAAAMLADCAAAANASLATSWVNAPFDASNVAAAADAVERRYVPITSLASLLHKPAAEGATEPLHVALMQYDTKEAVASVLVAATPDGKFRGLAIEDAEMSRRLLLRLAEGKKHSQKFQSPFQEYVVLETGAHLLVANAVPTDGSSREVMVVSGELDCRKADAQGRPEVEKMTLADAIDALTVSR